MSDPANPRPTLAGVAARAGVSASTASLVFSGAGPVAEATRTRVLEAAAALGYAGPDPTARSLRRGRTGVIGVVTEDRLGDAFRDPINLALLDGLGEELADEGFGLLVLPWAPDSGVDLSAVPMDAAILLGCSADLAHSVEVLQRRRLPLVAIEAPPLAGVVAIDLDNADATRRGAELLRELGHRRVALVTLPLDLGRTRAPLTPAREQEATAFTAMERIRGARAVFPDAGGVSAGGSTVAEGYLAGRALLDVPPADRPTAIVAQSDLLAAGVIRAAEELGIAVPAELSVLGFDGVRLDGITPYALTTLVQPAVEKGRAAGRAVREALAGRTPVPVSFASELRAGTTAAPPPTF
ncbi:LacI family DNA-binding transcriptional regulator [Protaetiibacter mangrovi]|uniref:LacI family DNA-binding transcriptional regulator n=1 Tax=Protaetiibacter mangrovi TaxID=2970926 RepID=A0ABT1ZCB9_9MICO|nr:LacI family DNA-binding transcriptional regulator [Protaetiibacter mangrovi]MCS0498356.1 LacI family DNA-binding transcriptional regulator [Protaetiibacter mangrovi]